MKLRKSILPILSILALACGSDGGSNTADTTTDPSSGGVGFLHAPLAPGEHVLHLEEFNDLDFMIGYSNTWNITVP